MFARIAVKQALNRHVERVFILRNTAVTPAQYTAILIGLDVSLLPTIHPPLISLGRFDDGFGNTLNWFPKSPPPP